jgi:hypothetical protein
MKTAVQWLRKELEEIPNYSAFYTNNYDWVDSIMNEASAIEKEQIKSAFTKGDLFAEDYFYPEKPNIYCSENYYNETYKPESNESV